MMIAAPLPAVAESSPDVAVLAGSCANCHGTDGRSPGPIAAIAGRPEAALAAQLKAFKAETPPPGTTIMNRIAKGYSDTQLEALAKYYAAIKPATPAAAKGKK
jgi:cytochrome c553